MARYASSKAVAVWEPINEPDPLDCGANLNCYSQGTCPNEDAVHRIFTDFFTSVGGMIHRLDPGSLVADGSVGSGDCGTATDGHYRSFLASPGIDVADYHDYSPITTTLPGDLARRVDAARSLGKPSIIAEAGVSGCRSGDDRADIFRRKMTAAFALGVTAYLPWYAGGDQGHPTCDTPIDTDSPTWGLLRDASWRPPQPDRATPAHELLTPAAADRGPRPL